MNPILPERKEEKMKKQKIYKIRPHHGMCLAYFEGKGYSQGFVHHMGEVLSLLEEGTTVEMTVAGDNICSACPNLKDGVCETADKVEAYDRAVLSFCNLKEKEQIEFSEFTERVQEIILETGKREEICGDCQWNEICSSRKSRWENRKSAVVRD